jgi:hypothetical protein
MVKGVIFQRTPALNVERGAGRPANRSKFATGSRLLLRPTSSTARAIEIGIYARIKKNLTTHDEPISAMLSAIRLLMKLPASRRRPIGFTAGLEEQGVTIHFSATGGL